MDCNLLPTRAFTLKFSLQTFKGRHVDVAECERELLHAPQTACESCSGLTVSVGGEDCRACEWGKEPAPTRAHCQCQKGRYDKAFGLISCYPSNAEWKANGFHGTIQGTELLNGNECLLCPDCVECSGGAPHL